jgi:hypothetical protein
LCIIPMVPAYAQNYCWEDETDMCGLISSNPADVFGGIMDPLETQVGQFALVILWGGLMGVVWLKTENIMLLAITGLMVSATITGLSETAQGIGMLMLGISVGILLFQLIRQRVSIIS